MYIGEHAAGNVVETYGTVIVLRSGNREHYIYYIIGEERCEDDECCPAEVGIAAEEIEKRHHGYHGKIGGIAHVHQLADEGMAESGGKDEGGLKAKDMLLPGGENMVEIGEHAVELVGVGIPPREQCHLRCDAGKPCDAAGPHPIDKPQGKRHCHNPDASIEH